MKTSIFITLFLVSCATWSNKTGRKSKSSSIDCKPTKMLGLVSDGKLSKMDSIVLKTAKTKCGEIYEKSPCVRSFKKTGKTSYEVICGRSEK